MSITSDSETVVQLLGSDPWARFDVWANRAWEAVEKSVELSIQIGPPVNADDGLDNRVIALFHAAEVAKEFAELTNPLGALVNVGQTGQTAATVHPELSVSLITDAEDYD